jgi:hypothetical protein
MGPAFRERNRKHMIRIVTEKGDSGWTVHIQGHLKGEDVPALEQECRTIGSISQLNLEDLRGLDEAGIRAIRTLTAGGVLVVGASPYIRMRLAPGSRGED